MSELILSNYSVCIKNNNNPHSYIVELSRSVSRCVVQQIYSTYWVSLSNQCDSKKTGCVILIQYDWGFSKSLHPSPMLWNGVIGRGHYKKGGRGIA